MNSVGILRKAFKILCLFFVLDDNYPHSTTFADEPDAPGRPTIMDWDRDHVDLQWPAPGNDGGSPITGYIVQKKEKGSPYWVNAVHVPAGQTSTTVPDLTEGQEYEFRVIAVNAAGQSEPSEPSDLVTAKPRFCKNAIPYCQIILLILLLRKVIS